MGVAAAPDIPGLCLATARYLVMDDARNVLTLAMFPSIISKFNSLENQYMYKQIELLEKSKTNFITLKQAKQYLRIEHNHDDEMIQDMLEMVLIAAENYIGLALQPASWKMIIYDELPSVIKFDHAPIVRVSQFKLYRNNEVIEFTNYLLDQSAEKIHLRRHYAIEKVEIIYHVGYEKLPAPIKQGMLEHLVRLYDLRGSDQSLPVAAKSLYQAYKRVRL